MVNTWRSNVLYLLLGLLIAFYGCAQPPSPERAQPDSNDAAITAQVKKALASDPRVRATFIEVDTSNGVVRLSGFADNRLEADEAVSVASNIAGVKRVQDDIVIRVSRDRRP